MPSFEPSTFNGNAVPPLATALSQICRPFWKTGLPSASSRRFNTLDEPGTSAPVVSSTNQTRTASGFTSGTPTGSAPVRRAIVNRLTRALTLMCGTPATLRNHGRSCSVILTSIIFAVHGGPSTTVSSTGSVGWRGQWRELSAHSTCPGGVEPTCGLRVLPYSSMRALIAALTPASHGKRTSPAAARAAASACV